MSERRRELQALIAWHTSAGDAVDLEELRRLCREYQEKYAETLYEREAYAAMLGRFEAQARVGRTQEAPMRDHGRPGRVAAGTLQPRGAPALWTFRDPVRLEAPEGVFLTEAAELRSSGHTLRRLAGQASMKRGLEDQVLFPHLNPRMAHGAHLRIPRYISIEGPRGTGKRFAAAALAASLDQPLISVEGSRLAARRRERVLEAVRAAHEMALARQPSVLLLASVDASTTLAQEAVRICLATEGLPKDYPRPHVIVVVTAEPHRPGGLPADLPNEFHEGYTFELRLKTAAFRGDAVREFIMAYVPAASLEAEPGMDWAAVSDAYTGMSGEEMRDALKEACRRAVARARGDRPIVGMEDLLGATDGMGAERTTKAEVRREEGRRGR